jgi:hypothetical protein
MFQKKEIMIVFIFYLLVDLLSPISVPATSSSEHTLPSTFTQWKNLEPPAADKTIEQLAMTEKEGYMPLLEKEEKRKLSPKIENLQKPGFNETCGTRIRNGFFFPKKKQKLATK